MVKRSQKQLPPVSQFLKTQPLDLHASEEDNEGFITQKGRRKRSKKPVQMKQESFKTEPNLKKLLQGQQQNPTQQSKWAQKNQEPVEREEVTQPRKVNNPPRLFVPSSPVVGASRSYASVAKSGHQDKTTFIIEVEIYTKKVQNNVLQLHGTKASSAEKALIATELLGLSRYELQSIAEPIGKRTHLKFKLHAPINIQEKFVGKDLLQIPRKNEGEPPSVLFCKILGVRNEKPEEPPTTVIISHLDCAEPKNVISKLLAPFGKVVSEPEEILFDKDGPEILVGVGSGNYKVDVHISRRPPNILAVEGNQVNLSFRGMKKSCFRCFGLGHKASVCKKEKASWEQYKLFLKEKFGMGPEFIGHTEDAKSKESQDLSSKAVEEPANEAQTVDETQTVNEFLTVDETQSVDDTCNQSQKDATENPTQTISSPTKPEKDLENTVGSAMEAKMADERTKNLKTSSEITRVSTRKRIPHEKLRN